MSTQGGNTKFKPGESRNPGGRPKSNLNKILSELLSKKAPGERLSCEQVIAQKIVTLALSGDQDAIEFVWDRMEGKPTQRVEGEINDTRRIVLVFPEAAK